MTIFFWKHPQFRYNWTPFWPHTVRQIIIDRIIFRRQFRKEQLGEISNPLFRVLKAFRHLAQLSFHLDHPIQDQMRQDHQRILLDHQVSIRKTLVQFIAILVYDVAEAHGNVSKCNNNIASDAGIFRRFQDFEEQPMMVITELRADTQEFAECERCHAPQCSVL